MNTKEQAYIILCLLFRLKIIEQRIEYYSGKSLLYFLNQKIDNFKLTYTEFKGLVKYLETTGDLELDSHYFGDIFTRITYRGIRSFEFDYDEVIKQINEKNLGLEKIQNLMSIPDTIHKISPKIVNELKSNIDNLIDRQIDELKKNSTNPLFEDLILSLKTLKNESAKRIPNLEVIGSIINDLRSYIETRNIADLLIEEYNLN